MKTLFGKSKGTTIIALVLIASVFATVYPFFAGVNAQNQATVNVLESIGGSTDPLPGTYNYNDGTQVTLTATPSAEPAASFVTWLVSTDASNDSVSANPYTFTVTGGVTYNVSAVFALLVGPIYNPPIQTPTDPSIFGSVTIMQALGGSTQPAAGTYYFASVYKLELTAVAQSGYKFSYWVISGDTNTGHGGYPFTLTPTDNPYTFDCGLGYRYSYQPVFTPVGSTTPPPPTTPGTTATGISTELIIAIIAIVIAIVAVIASVVYVNRSKK